MWSILWRAAVCLATVFAVLVVGLMLHERFSWGQLRAETMVFLDTVSSGDATEVITALASRWLVPLYLAACVVIGALLGRWSNPTRRSRKSAPSR